MQQLVCPNCGATVRAENINVQELVAVCGTCDHVFKFDSPTEQAKKAKRRKVKQPEKLTLREDPYRLHMNFHTNFRLDQNQAFLGGTIGGVISGLTVLFMLASGDELYLLPLMFTLMAVLWGYQAALVAYNKTHIDMDDEKIRVSRKPLFAFRPPIDVSLSGAEKIDTVETEISVERGYDTPRYRVYIQRVDGTQRMVVNDLTEDYAYYVSRVLNERLQELRGDYDAGRLVDGARDEHAIYDDQPDMQARQVNK